MSLPTVDEGLGFITYDDVATNSALLSKQQSDLSGNVTQRQFCIDAFHLAGNRDVSNALIVSDDITTETDNVLAFIGSNVKSVQRTYLSNQIISSLSQNFISNAYKMIEGIQLSNPLNSKFLIPPPFTQVTETKIVASDKQADDNFGNSVAIDGSYAIVGAYYEYPGGINAAGSAYIFEIDTSGNWSEKQKIVASDKQAGDLFGYSVAISGNYAIVGAHKSGNGSAYLFERINGSWSTSIKLLHPTPTTISFGVSVAISGNYAIVGTDLATAYFFERVSGSWTEKQIITGVNAWPPGSTSIDGSYAIVGAAFDHYDENGDVYKKRAGSAYIFERTNGIWNQIKKIVASDRAVSDSFGNSVAISGNYAIVGAKNEDHDASGNDEVVGAGSAYIFEG